MSNIDNENFFENMFKEYPDILIIDDLTYILGIGKNTAYQLLITKEIYSKIIGKQYKIPKISVIEYLYHTQMNKYEILKDYKDILDFNQVLEILRKPSRNVLYKILKNKELFSIRIANAYKIPKNSLIEFIFKDCF